MTSNIRIQQLRFSYGKQFELQVDELLIDQGEIFGLLGPSGSGKTTLINILTKEITNFQGIVEISGKSLNKLNFSKIGVLTDQNNLYSNSSNIDAYLDKILPFIPTKAYQDLVDLFVLETRVINVIQPITVILIYSIIFALIFVAFYRKRNVFLLLTKPN